MICYFKQPILSLHVWMMKKGEIFCFTGKLLWAKFEENIYRLEEASNCTRFMYFSFCSTEVELIKKLLQSFLRVCEMSFPYYMVFSYKTMHSKNFSQIPLWRICCLKKYYTFLYIFVFILLHTFYASKSLYCFAQLM